MLNHRHRMLGFNLIEVLIGLAVMGILMLMGMPSLSAWMQSTQVRNSAESMVSALQLARTEALRRNQSVQFSLTDGSLGASCAVSLTGTDWVVSLADPTGKCDVTPSDTVDPMILQKRGGNEGSANATVTATGSASVTFNGLGRVTGYPVGGILIDVKNSTATCQDAGGSIRCLRVAISPSGAIRMCDPAVSDAADPRRC
jgi:type IV fimbrial biogenesis protein FimT